MPVVSNTSPIMNLAIIGQLHLLRKQFGEIRIPPAVFDELHVEDNLPGSQALKDAISSDWILVESIADQAFVRVLQNTLDNGESEAIALAVQLGAERLLLDERDGRRIAKELRLDITGVLGVLIRAHREGNISSLRETMNALRQNAGFFIASDLYDFILREVGESTDQEIP